MRGAKLLYFGENRVRACLHLSYPGLAFPAFLRREWSSSPNARASSRNNFLKLNPHPPQHQFSSLISSLPPFLFCCGHTHQDVSTLAPSLATRFLFVRRQTSNCPKCLPVVSQSPSDCPEQRICKGERREGIHSQRCPE